MCVPEGCVVGGNVVEREGRDVFKFQQMSFAVSIDSRGCMLPDTDSSSVQGPEAELYLPHVSSCLTAECQEPCLPSKAQVQFRGERILSSYMISLK